MKYYTYLTRLLILIFTLVILVGPSYAQLSTINGKITDEVGVPLVGANIIIKGTTIGVVTDVDGIFSINAVKGDELEISYLGYVTTVITVSSEANYNITLVEGINLGEVQVVGSRSYRRSATDSPVAVDIIDIAD